MLTPSTDGRIMSHMQLTLSMTTKLGAALEGDARTAFDTVMMMCAERGGCSTEHAAHYAREGRNAALDRKSDRWACAYARVITALEAL